MMMISKLSKTLQFALVALTLGLGFEARANGDAALHQNDLSLALVDGLLKPRVYSGFTGKIQTLPKKWYCDDRRYFWSVNWAAEINDVEVDFDLDNPNVTSVHVVLKGSKLRAQYYRKGGGFCSWNGAEGELNIGRIDVDFSLVAVPTQDFPDISLDGLRIESFKLRNVQATALSIFTPSFRATSDGFGEWVENNLNGLIAKFLQTGLKKRLDAAINKEVQRRLKEREDSLHHPDPTPLQNIH